MIVNVITNAEKSEREWNENDNFDREGMKGGKGEGGPQTEMRLETKRN